MVLLDIRSHRPVRLYVSNSSAHLLLILSELHKTEESLFQPFQILTLFYFKHHSDWLIFLTPHDYKHKEQVENYA